MLRLLSAVGLAVWVMQTSVLPELIVPNVPDLTIRVRHLAIGDEARLIETLTMSFHGARERREVEVLSGRSPEKYVGLLQCDRRRNVSIYSAFHTYNATPIESPNARLEWARRTGRGSAIAETGPEVLRTIETIDTGERKPVGSFIARHVVTNRTTTGPRDYESPPERTDGWYIDLPINQCLDRPPSGEVWLHLLTGGTPEPRQRLETRGKPERGYAVEYVHTISLHTGDLVDRQELVNISSAPVDPELFEIPRGYLPALRLPDGGADVTRPDTMANRIHAYWEFARDWVNAWIR
jgi:hypothetical protein